MRSLDLDDLGALAIAIGTLGGIVLLGLLVAWWAPLGLFFALLVVWAVVALRISRRAPLETPSSAADD